VRRTALPVSRDQAREICLSSVSGVAGNYGQTNYALTKAALIGYVAARAQALAPRGITVNAVAPGIIDTGMSEGVFGAEAIKQLVPMRRAGKPEEVADLVAFLASDQAAFISGQVISINGAMI